MVFQDYSQNYTLVNRARESGNYRSSGQWHRTNLKELGERLSAMLVNKNDSLL